MKKYYYLLIACLSLLTMQAQNTRGGIYDLPLTGTTKPPGIIEETDLGGFAPSGSKRYTSQGLVLSEGRVGYSGFAIDDLEIDPREGIRVEFEYTMATILGSGYKKGGGMTFYVFDAKEKFKLGYYRSALGYAYNLSYSTANQAALAGAYIGVAFDTEGTFKSTGDITSYELREGIERDFGNVFKKNHITIRGAAQKSTSGNHGFGVHHFGTPVLLTKYFGADDVRRGDITMATIDYRDGSYDFDTNMDANDFDIGNGGYATNPNFQKIVIELVPDKGYKGMYVTIKGENEYEDMIDLVDEFYYPNTFTAYGKVYRENNTIYGEEYDFETKIPDKVKIGFAGFSIDNHEQKTIIRNIKVSTIDEEEEAPELDDVVADMCVSDTGKSKGGVIDVDVLQNTGYDITWGSFMFVDEDGDKLSGDDRVYENSTGKWEFSSYYEEITFTVKDGSFKPGDEADIYYSIELDGVRSKPALFRIKGIACGAVVNPHIRSKAGEK